MGKTSSMTGHSGESSTRYPGPQMQGLMSVMERALMGQLVNPPETAISVPQQQAATLAQAGPLGAADYLGIGATQSLLPGPRQAGLQTREQLGLPPRSSYFTDMPTNEQVAALGMLPPLQAAHAPGGKPAATRLSRLESKRQTQKRQLKEREIIARNPEEFAGHTLPAAAPPRRRQAAVRRT